MKRDYPERPIIGVGAVIIHRDRVLLVRRATEPLKGEWSVPGGMLELGEKLRDGLRREVLEETGLQVDPGEVLDVFDSIFRDEQGRTQYHYVLIDYLCRAISEEAKAASDVSEVRWVREDELAAMGLRDSIEQVVRKGLLKGRAKYQLTPGGSHRDHSSSGGFNVADFCWLYRNFALFSHRDFCPGAISGPSAASSGCQTCESPEPARYGLLRRGPQMEHSVRLLGRQISRHQ